MRKKQKTWRKPHTQTQQCAKLLKKKVKKKINIKQKHLINKNHSTLTVGGIYNKNKTKEIECHVKILRK